MYVVFLPSYNKGSVSSWFSINSNLASTNNEFAASLPTRTHNTAKLYVQKKYFGYENLSIPLLVFVGRITEQKGVHLICEMAEELIVSQNRNIQIIVGGIANEEDPYGRYCMNRMNYLRTYYGDCFWVCFIWIILS